MVVGDISDEALYRRMFGKRLARKLIRSTLYADHYDAACALAIPLLKNSIGLNVGPRKGRVADSDRATLVRCAVRELHRAIDCADSQMMTLRWDWIVSEDPDLDELRRTTQFRAFEAARLPSAKRAPRRSSQAQQIELARHAAQLVSSAARMLEREWHNRASRANGGLAIDVHDVRAWWDEQRENWDAVARLAVDHRDWRTRLQWIHRMQAQALRQGSRSFVIRHPDYAEAPIDALWFEAEVDSPAAVEAAALDLFDAHAALAELCGDLLDSPPGSGDGDAATEE